MNKKILLIIITVGILVVSNPIFLANEPAKEPIIITYEKPTKIKLMPKEPIEPYKPFKPVTKAEINRLNDANAKIKLEKEQAKAEVARAKKVKAVKVKAEAERKASLSRGGDISEYRSVTLVCTFYTSSLDETWGDGTITASGKKIRAGMVASNHLPFGTEIHTNAYGNLIVEDTGNPNNFPYISNSEYRVDIYISKQAGESMSQCQNRALEMGIQKVKGKIKL